MREQNPEAERLGEAGGGPGVRKTEPVTVVVVDDEPLAREGLLMLLEQDSEVKVVGEAGSGDEALARAVTIDFDVFAVPVHQTRQPMRQIEAQETAHHDPVGMPLDDFLDSTFDGGKRVAEQR